MVFQKVHLELTNFWSYFIGLSIFLFLFLQSPLGVDNFLCKVNKISDLQKRMVDSALFVLQSLLRFRVALIHIWCAI